MTVTTTDDQAAASGGGPDRPPWAAMPAAMIVVDQLTAHPGNVRDDLHLDAEFCASIAEAGVRVPLLVTTAGDGGLRVIEGHRRLAAAIRAGLSEVPCVLDAARAGDDAGQFLDMAVANGAGYRRNFTAQQEADALFAASEAGATRTRIRKATGRSAGQVKAALQAGSLSAETRTRAARLGRQPDLETLALLAEFDGDDDAVGQLVRALTAGYGVEHVAERIRRDRAEAAQHEQLVTELTATGVTVTDTLPDGARRLDVLTHDGDELTPASHAQCPARGAFFSSLYPLDPVHYCASPDAYGHIWKYQPAPAEPGGGAPDPVPDPPGGGDGGPGRRLVIEGNKAWAAAAEVRKRWLRTLLARRTAPKEVMPFLARQLLTMPEPLCASLGTAHQTGLFADLAGQAGGEAVQACDTSPAGRLPLLMLAPVVTAYEREMSGDSGDRRSTWRADRYSPCSWRAAGSYLAFLASVGYELAPIEQAVADGVSYTGDHPGEPLITALDSDTEDPGQPDEPGRPDAGSGQDADTAGEEAAA